MLKRQVLFSTFSFSKQLFSGDPVEVYFLPHGPNRLGDTLMRYSMCKIDSIEFNTPLFYIPFDYSEELMLSETDYSITKFAFPENYVLSRKTKGIPTNDGDV